MKSFKYLLIIALIGCATGLSYKRARNPKALSQSEAEYRAQSLTDISYKMEISFEKEAEDYKGKQNISFKLGKVYPLRIDFVEGEIGEVVVNGAPMDDISYNKAWLTIPASALKLGVNEIKIAFSHKFSNRGAGIHRFQDPKDGRIYTYTDFEPFDANKFAPFFDQPDLKADYQLLVRAPREWTVITSRYADSVLKKGDHKVWNFPKSAIFSTYIFSLHAGPYKVWTDVYVDEEKGQRIPLDIYTRQSMAKYFEPEVKEWFEVTKQGFEFFQDFFGTDYPYKKYAQLLVPEFNSGAMENVAAVTFNERAIHRTKASYSERRGRSNTILHEMAHMWFGNLVTMKWWDNLWLNESFATFMAYLALEQNTVFKDSFESFYARTKQWAYWNDDLVITHPILGEIENTDEAMLSFDGITYGKGASVLKQLYYYLGEENFKKGLKLYFDRHSEGNTVLADFFKAFEDVSKVELDSWVDQWLKTAGTNTARAEYECKEDKIVKFEIYQGFKKEHPYYRTHKTQVALLYKNKKNGKLEVKETIKTEYAKERTLIEEMKDKACPTLAFINYKDFDFVHIQFSKKDLAAMKENLSMIEDDMIRLMSYNSLFDMVRNAKLSLRDYTEIIIPHLKKERNYNVADKGIQGLMGVITYLFSKEIEDEQLITKIEEFLWSQIKEVKNSEIKRQYFYAYLSVAHSKNALSQIEKVYLGKIKLEGVPIGMDQKWEMLRRLKIYDYGKVDQYVAELKKKDDSDRAKKSLLAIDATEGSLEVKKKWYQASLQKMSPYSLKEMGSALSSLFPASQMDLKKQMSGHFYSDLKKHMLDRQMRMQRLFVGSFIPAFCDEPSSDKLNEFIEANEDLPVGIMKSLKITLQENNRCIDLIY